MQSKFHPVYAMTIALALLVISLVSAQAQVIFPGDGSEEPGFVAPPKVEAPPPPPANMASAETYIPYPGPPVVPMSRSEKKNPPSPPVMFTKIKSQYGEIDWATRPNDLNNLLKSMKDKIDVNFQCECKFFSEINPDPEKNPILYRSGHFHFKLSAEERQKMRDYLLKGGMIIFNTGMGSKPFFESAKAELQAIFPETPVQRLAPDHPIFHSYYDLAQVGYRQGVRTKGGFTGNEPYFIGVTIDCRTVAVVSRFCMASGWDELENEEIQAYSAESAQKLGINLMAYATAQRAWAKQASHAMKFVDADTGTAGKVSVAQIIYDGEWKTRHAGISVLLQQFNQRTDIPVKFAHQELRLSDPKIFNAPLIYITGHEDFRLNPQEIQGLREYLKNGGFLFAEACCGRKGFDEAFRREMKKVLPESDFEFIPAGDEALFSMPNQVRAVGVTPALTSQLDGKTAVSPRLMGIQVDGHYTVIHSPYGMCGGWEMAQNPYALGYDDAGALSLGENILLYAVTH